MRVPGPGAPSRCVLLRRWRRVHQASGASCGAGVRRVVLFALGALSGVSCVFSLVLRHTGWKIVPLGGGGFGASSIGEV